MQIDKRTITLPLPDAPLKTFVFKQNELNRGRWIDVKNWLKPCVYLIDCWIRSFSNKPFEKWRNQHIFDVLILRHFPKGLAGGSAPLHPPWLFHPSSYPNVASLKIGQYVQNIMWYNWKKIQNFSDTRFGNINDYTWWPM